MKTIAAILFSILFVPVFAQNDAPCRDFECMMRQAQKAFSVEKNYEKAVTSAIAAKSYSNADVERAEKLLAEIFVEINSLREEADRQTKIAQQEAEKAKKAQREAEFQQQVAEEIRRRAENQRDTIAHVLNQVDELIKKGKKLETTFSESQASDLLFAEALSYFAFDTVSQSRD